MQGNNTLGIKKCQPPLLQIQNILKKLEFLVTIHFQLSNRLPHLDSKKNATETQKKFVCARVIFGHLGHLKVLQHLIQEVFPVITLRPQSNKQSWETTYSRIRYTTGKRNSALLTTFAFTLAVKVYVKVPVFWTLGTTAVVLQQINTFQKFVQRINYL